jgi:hypothetical protein
MKRDGVSIEPVVNSSAKSRPPTPETSEDVTLKQLIASTVCPNKFTVVARVTDCYPFELNQATYLRCMKCETMSAQANSFPERR